MPWFNVDDGFANSKPVMRIIRRYRAACIGVWTLCGSWSAKELTDGFIPQAVAEEYGATPKITEHLVMAGLWEYADHDGTTGLRFRNWSKWQRTKQQVLDYRAAEADRKRNRRNSIKQAGEQGQPEMSAECPSGTDTGLPPGHHAESGIPKPLPTPLPKPVVVNKGGEQTSVAAPARHCPRHMPGGTLDRCAACGDARREYDRWLATLDIQAKAELQARACEEAARRVAESTTHRFAIGQCELCDDDGYLTGTSTVCDHIDRTHTHRAGMAAVRAALGVARTNQEEG